MFKVRLREAGLTSRAGCVPSYLVNRRSIIGSLRHRVRVSAIRSLSASCVGKLYPTHRRGIANAKS